MPSLLFFLCNLLWYNIWDRAPGYAGSCRAGKRPRLRKGSISSGKSDFFVAFLYKPVYNVLDILRKWGEKDMANIKSAKKRISVINAKTARNRRVKEHVKAVLKNFDKAVADGDFAAAEEKLRLAEKKLMKAASKNVIHKKAASRKVSRLYKKLNKAQAK